MPLHPTIQAMLERSSAYPPLESLTPDQIRATDLQRYAIVPRPPVARVEDRTIPGPRGPVRIRVYRPATDGIFPVVTFFHGSGFVICSIDTHDGLCRQICLHAHAVVVSVDYALAPENKFPAGIDDCLCATEWVAGHAADIGADPERHVLVGDSAGGTMALVTAMRARDRSGPRIRAQILMYPVTDYPDPAPPSYLTRGTGFGLTADAMRYFWGHYLNHPSEGEHPHASPLRARDFSGLPATYVMTAEYDPLRDEGEMLCQKLSAAGVPTELRRYADMNHGFMSWVGVIDRAQEALEAACVWLSVRL